MRMLFTAALAVTVLAAPASRAATEAAFTAPAFAAAQQAGKPILVDVTAPWCPTCAQQRPILSKLYDEPAYKDLVVFNVDFDSQKDVLRALNVRTQSTLIAFHGAKETARSAGETKADPIRALVASTAQ